MSDRDTRFTSELWRCMCKSLGIQQKMSTAYHPQTDGQAERTNQTIEQMLRCAILGDEARWANLLPLLEFAYNSARHSSTKQAPFELLYGFVPPKPICKQLNIPTASGAGLLPLQAEIKLQQAKRELEAAQAYQKKYADAKRRPASFQVGQEVWLSTANLPIEEGSKALRHRFRGPFKILELVGENAAKLDLPASWLIHPVFHVSLLSPVTAEPHHLRRPGARQAPERNREFIVDAIVSHRDGEHGREYEVRWLDGSTTWEPADHLKNAPQARRNYLRGTARRHRLSPRGRG